MRERDLRRDVVLLETEMRWGHRERVDGLTGRDASELRDVDLDRETAAWFQMGGDVAEARNLFVLRGQVRDRVANEVGERERPGHSGGREVADGHVDFVRARLPLQLRNHGRRQLDPVNANTPPAERQRYAPGTHAELERVTRSCQLGEEIHRRVDDRGLEQVRPEVLVLLRNPLVEVELGHRCTIAGVQRKPPPISVARGLSGARLNRSSAGGAGMGLDLGSVEVYAGPAVLGGPDDLDAVVRAFIGGAKKRLLIAVQELDSRAIAEAVLAAKVAKVRVQLILEGDYLIEDPPIADPWAEVGANEDNRAIHSAVLRAGVDVITDLNPKIFHQKFVVRDPGLPTAAVLTGSTNFTLTDTGKNPPGAGAVSGNNLNHVVVLHGQEAAGQYLAEFSAIGQGPSASSMSVT